MCVMVATSPQSKDPPSAITTATKGMIPVFIGELLLFDHRPDFSADFFH
jgi:hypothetical protein